MNSIEPKSACQKRNYLLEWYYLVQLVLTLSKEKFFDHNAKKKISLFFLFYNQGLFHYNLVKQPLLISFNNFIVHAILFIF